MTQQFVIVQHPGDKKEHRYLFRIDDTKYDIKAGAYVFCKTYRSNHELGLCVTSAFEADPAVLALAWGTDVDSIKPITALLRPTPLYYEEDNTK